MGCDDNANLILTYEGSHLWLGNYKAALDYHFLKDNNISVVINCTREIPFIYNVTNKPLKLETLRIPVFDTPFNKDNQIMKDNLQYVIPFINTKFFKEHKNILVHCAAGKSRSATVVSAFIFNYVKNTIKNSNNVPGKVASKVASKVAKDDQIMINAIKYIIKKRNCAFYYGSKVNFKKALQEYLNIKFEFPEHNVYGNELFF